MQNALIIISRMYLSAINYPSAYYLISHHSYVADKNSENSHESDDDGDDLRQI